MFFAAVATSDLAIATRTLSALDLHSQHLASTGFVGDFAIRSLPGLIVAWDKTSPHAHVDESDDALALYGGYVAESYSPVDEGTFPVESPYAWGEFAALIARFSPNFRVTSFADVAGSWPMYFGSDESRAVVSNDPHFVAVALGRSKLSAQGAYEVLAYGHALGAQTTLDGVRRLFPGERIEISHNAVGPKLIVSRVPGYEYKSDDRSIDQRAIAAYSELAAAVKQIPPLAEIENCVVQLSGGLDSRLTAATLSRMIPGRPRAVTIDLADDAEIQIAHQVAETIGYPHEVQVLNDMDGGAGRAGWALTGGQVSVHAAAGNILAYEVLREDSAGNRVIVGAWPGDCLIGSYVPSIPTMVSRLFARVVAADWAAKRDPRWKERGILVSGPQAKRVAAFARRELRRRVVSASGTDAAQKISFYAMFSRQPAFSYVSPAILSSSVLAVTPMLARPYVTTLLSMKGEEIIGKNMYRRMICSAFPELREIPYAATGVPIDASLVKPRWRISSTDDLFHLLPDSLQRLVRTVVARRDPRPESRDLSESASSEVRFWNELFEKEGVPARVQLDGLTVDARAASDVHVRSVALALSWSKNYIERASRDLAHEAT